MSFLLPQSLASNGRNGIIPGEMRYFERWDAKE
jgi:hypothetical protein